MKTTEVFCVCLLALLEVEAEYRVAMLRAVSYMEGLGF